MMNNEIQSLRSEDTKVVGVSEKQAWVTPALQELALQETESGDNAGPETTPGAFVTFS